MIAKDSKKKKKKRKILRHNIPRPKLKEQRKFSLHPFNTGCPVGPDGRFLSKI